jgi:hypothetical protein
MGGDTLAPAAARTGVLLAMTACVVMSFPVVPVLPELPELPEPDAALDGRRTRATAV